MTDGQLNPWKVATITLLLVFAVALMAALGVANWGAGPRPETPKAAIGGKGVSPRARPAAVPTAADIEACNNHAKSQAGDKTTEVVKDAVIGGVVGVTAGTLYGLNEAKKNDVRYQEAHRQCMRARGYVG